MPTPPLVTDELRWSGKSRANVSGMRTPATGVLWASHTHFDPSLREIVARQISQFFVAFDRQFESSVYLVSGNGRSGSNRLTFGCGFTELQQSAKKNWKISLNITNLLFSKRIIQLRETSDVTGDINFEFVQEGMNRLAVSETPVS